MVAQAAPRAKAHGFVEDEEKGCGGAVSRCAAASGYGEREGLAAEFHFKIDAETFSVGVAELVVGVVGAQGEVFREIIRG